MHKGALIAGGVFGFIAPFVGLVFGLQISTTVGNILAFPLIGLVILTGVPFGKWHPVFMLVPLVISVVFWAFVFNLLSKALRLVWRH